MQFLGRNFKFFRKAIDTVKPFGVPANQFFIKSDLIVLDFLFSANIQLGGRHNPVLVRNADICLAIGIIRSFLARKLNLYACFFASVSITFQACSVTLIFIFHEQYYNSSFALFYAEVIRISFTLFLRNSALRILFLRNSSLRGVFSLSNLSTYTAKSLL